jgi:pimeloyl-ACP methyl ester carboxylesterase
MVVDARIFSIHLRSDVDLRCSVARPIDGKSRSSGKSSGAQKSLTSRWPKASPQNEEKRARDRLPGGPHPAVGLLLVHPFPHAPWSPQWEESLDAVAARLCSEIGCLVVAPRLRGIGESAGNFSVAGWCRDIVAAVDYTVGVLQEAGHGAGRLHLFGLGYGVGGSCLLSVASGDLRISGVVAAGAPAELADLPMFRQGFWERARAVGIVRDRRFPKDPHAWRRELIAFAPIHHAKRLGGRPVLLVYREGDRIGGPSQAKRLAEVIGQTCETIALPKSSTATLLKNDRVVSLAASWIAEKLSSWGSADAAL